MAVPLDLHRVDQFLAVARHGSLTRAAAELHISQQGLSSAIRALEQDLGVTLLGRQGRRITLTPAGESLRDQAPPILAAAGVVRSRVRLAAAPTPKPFVVAHTPAITAEEAYDLLAPIRRDHRDVSIDLRTIYPAAIADSLRDGTVDVALRRGVAPPKGLADSIFAHHAVRVALPAGHRLAGAERLAIAELANELIVVWAPPGASYYTDFLLAACRRSGFEPDYVVSNAQGVPPVAAAADQSCAAFVTAPAGPALSGRVQVIDLIDPPLAPVQALWIPHTSSAPREAMIGTPPAVE